jgi:hypothetical protein
MGTCDRDANGEATSGEPTRARVRMRDGRDGTARSSDEVPDKRMEPRRCVKRPDLQGQPAMGGTHEPLVGARSLPRFALNLMGAV